MDKKITSEKKWHLITTLIFWFLVGFFFGCVSKKAIMVCNNMPVEKIIGDTTISK